MKKIILLLFFVSIGNLFANVDTRLTQISNSGGTLVLDVEAMSTTGTVDISTFQNALQLDATFQGQTLGVSFSNELFPASGYNTTEDYNSGTGRIQFVYTFNSGARSQIGSSWTPVLRITISYTQGVVNGNITWYSSGSGNPKYYVTNATSQNITGVEGTTLSNIPLPVELSSFQVNSVEGINAQLNWETATEVNNYGFEVERAIKTEIEDGIEETEAEIEWENIAFVEGHGNSNSPKLYSFKDESLVGGSKFLYRLKQIDLDGTFEYSDIVEVEVLPNKYELLQNYPNPFNPSTKIRFSLPEDTKLAINIYNILGEKVFTLLNKELKAGFHQIQFNSKSAGYRLASGVYVYTLESKNFTQVKKMILLK